MLWWNIDIVFRFTVKPAWMCSFAILSSIPCWNMSPPEGDIITVFLKVRGTEEQALSFVALRSTAKMHCGVMGIVWVVLMSLTVKQGITTENILYPCFLRLPREIREIFRCVWGWIFFVVFVFLSLFLMYFCIRLPSSARTQLTDLTKTPLKWISLCSGSPSTRVQEVQENHRGNILLCAFSMPLAGLCCQPAVVCAWPDILGRPR